MCQPEQDSIQLVSSYKYGVQYARNAGAYKIATEIRNLGHNVEVFDFATYFTDEEVKALMLLGGLLNFSIGLIFIINGVTISKALNQI